MASELPQEQLQGIVDIVRKLKPGITLEVETAIDPELIGGFTVKVGDVLLDASVKNELKKLRLKLLS
jgi:F0F1-type ATP synthase delta subunit